MAASIVMLLASSCGDDEDAVVTGDDTEDATADEAGEGTGRHGYFWKRLLLLEARICRS